MSVPYEPLPMAHDTATTSATDARLRELDVTEDLRRALLARSREATVLVLPRATPLELDEDGRATYSGADATAVEALRRAGVRSDFLHLEPGRRVIWQFSADVVVAIGLFIAEAVVQHEIGATVEYLKGRIAAAWQDQRVNRVELKLDLFRQRVSNGHSEIEGRRLSGPATPETIELARSLIEDWDDRESP